MSVSHLSYYPIILSVIMLTSCVGSNFDCIRGNDNYIDEIRSVEPFKAVSLNASYNVTIIQGDKFEVNVNAEENILDRIITRVENETLTIKDKNGRCIINGRNVNVLVTVESIEAINLSGSGSIRADSLSGSYFNIRKQGSGEINLGIHEANQVEIESFGSGELNMTGDCSNINIDVTGSGKVDLRDLTSEICFANLTGSGDVYVNVSELLDVSITGSGKLYYKGSPRIDSEVTGSGSIVRL